MNKKIVITLIIIVAIVGFGTYYYFSTKKTSYVTAVVQKGTIAQEVSTSGSVEPPTTINLYFKTSGKLAELDAHVGDTVEAGQVLAKQEMDGLDSSLAQAEAGVMAAQAQLDQLLAGASSENIKIYETAAANAQNSLANARQAKDNSSQNAVGAVKDAYAKADDAVHNRADRLFSDPTGPNPSFGVTVSSGTSKFQIEADSNTEITIDAERKNAENTLKSWNTEINGSSLEGNLDDYLTDAGQNLQEIQKILNNVAGVVNGYNSTTLADDTVYQSYRTDILTARTNVDAALSGITAAKTSLSAAEANISATSGVLKTTQDQLAAAVAPARQSDAAVYIARINQAQAAATLVEEQVKDLTISAPLPGLVAKTNGNPGEIVGPGTIVISLIPNGTLEVKLNVSEDTITGVKVGQKAVITLDALGSQQLTGKITGIEPAGTIIAGAVYYQTTVMLDQVNPLIRPDMTANALIETAIHNNVLIVPMSAVQTSGNTIFIQVLQGQKAVQKNVQTGIKSNNGMVEIVSGLEDGDLVILGTK